LYKRYSPAPPPLLSTARQMELCTAPLACTQQQVIDEINITYTTCNSAAFVTAAPTSRANELQRWQTKQDRAHTYIQYIQAACVLHIYIA
jgi:hypothetical protein